MKEHDESTFTKIKQFFCKHHFHANELKRENDLSYIHCKKCNKKFSNYYGYTLFKHGTYERMGGVKND